MTLFLWIIWFVTYIPGAVCFEIYIMHMFQQNSYKPREYREWLAVTVNIGRLLGKTLYGLIFAAAFGHRRAGVFDCGMFDEPDDDFSK